MDRNLSYEIAVKREDSENCLTMLYGCEEQYDVSETFLGDELPGEEQTRSVFGGLALLFAASLAVVILLML